MIWKKQLLKNKQRAITYGGVVLLMVIVNVIGFRFALKKSLDVIRVPVAKQTISPRTEISMSDIEYIEVPKSYLSADICLDENEIIGKYTDVQTIVAANSFFYQELLFEKENMPDYPATLLQDQEMSFSLGTDLIQMSGNSLVVGQRVDLFVALKIKQETIVDKLISGVRIIGVKDKKGLNLSDKQSSKIPHVVILAIPQEAMPYVIGANKIGDIRLAAYANENKGDEAVFHQDAKVLSYLNHD